MFVSPRLVGLAKMQYYLQHIAVQIHTTQIIIMAAQTKSNYDQNARSVRLFKRSLLFSAMRG